MLSLRMKRLLCVSMVIIVTVVADRIFNPTAIWYERDIFLGGMAGMALAMLIFPRRVTTDFQQSMVLLLSAYADYFLAIAAYFLRENDGRLAEEKKQVVERLLQSSLFPEWVYRAGFSDFFREGHRHFLVRAEQVGQVLFAMHGVARHAIDPALLDRCRLSMSECVLHTETFMTILLARLKGQVSEADQPDLVEDIVALENNFHTVVSLPLELLDMSADAIHFAAFIYDLKDLRKMLLKLVEALR